MARAVNSSFYKTSKWIRCRTAYLKKQPLCEQCLERGEYVPSKYVHHIEYLNENNVHDDNIAYGFDNLKALCFECHEELHGRKSKKRYKVMADGSVVIL